MRIERAVRAFGAVFGILGTACVVGLPSAFGLGPSAFLGYWLWTAANALWIAVNVGRRDWFAVMMFGCYQAATIWGLVKG